MSRLTQAKISFIQNYISRLEKATESLVTASPQYAKQAEDDLFNIIMETKNVLTNELPLFNEAILFRTGTGQRDAKTVIGMLQLYLVNNEQVTGDSSKQRNQSQIFLSHKSLDRKYGDALQKLIVGLGVKKEQLIYTSHPLHKIPLDKNIYDYLRDAINGNVFVIILWSNSYLASPACLSEMGAAWLAKTDYTNIYTPDFDFGNPQYHECAVDTRKMGAVLNGSANCKMSMVELKNKIISLFDLKVDEATSMYLIDQFITEIQ